MGRDTGPTVPVRPGGASRNTAPPLSIVAVKRAIVQHETRDANSPPILHTNGRFLLRLVSSAPEGANLNSPG